MIRPGDHVTLRNACALPQVSGVLHCDGADWWLLTDERHCFRDRMQRLVRVGCEHVIEAAVVEMKTMPDARALPYLADVVDALLATQVDTRLVLRGDLVGIKSGEAK